MLDHKTVSLADQVFEHIENDILSGKYSRGEMLSESRLCSELGVSRTPIRESLRRLEQEHLVEDTQKGLMVIGITEKDLEDIFLIREQIEGLAAAMAAKHRTEEQLKELKEVLEFQEFYLSKQDAEQIKHMDNRFHSTLYKLSGSMAFYDTLVPLHKKVQKYRKASVEMHSRAVASVEEHRLIFEAIAEGDAQKAMEYSRQHVMKAHDHIRKFN